jgi:hypothetical protein
LNYSIRLLARQKLSAHRNCNMFFSIKCVFKEEDKISLKRIKIKMKNDAQE